MAKTAIITIRISEEMKGRFYRLAGKAEMRPASFMRMALLLGVSELQGRLKLDDREDCPDCPDCPE